MNRIRGGVAIALGVALLLAAGGIARAQEITGRLTGRVSDRDTNMALGGVTVVLQGPQGEDATLTDDKGEYHFTSLPVGTYVIRFYVANAAAQFEQSGVVVSADKLTRLNAKIAGVAAQQAQPQEKYVITGRPPVVDIGSARVGATFDSEYTTNVPLARTYGDIIDHTPGAFVDPSGNVSIGGATGLENIYIVNGVNVTGIEYGNLEAGTASISGGTNLPLEFLQQIDVAAGGYQATLGGGMGGVINSVLKTGSNEFHGSAFGYWSPYWLSKDPTPITTLGRSLGYVRKPDFDTSIGAEVGGPILKDKLFFWVGFAPRFQDTHVFRQTYATAYDPSTGGAALDANGNPIQNELTYWRARIPESRQTYYYAGTLDFIPRPEHHLTVSAFGSPNFNDQMRSYQNIEFISNPAWAQERLTKSNSDFSAHWTSKLFDHHWQIDALAAVHTEYFYDRSPNATLNDTNQLDYFGANLWDLEHAPGCQPITDSKGNVFQPCPVDNYQTGGFGLVKKDTGARWMADLKSTHLFEAGGHHELAWGWHPEYVTFDQDRWYSGPAGQRAIVQLYPGAGGDIHNTYSFFTFPKGNYPSDVGTLFPATDLLYPPYYRDDLKASVKSWVNALFLQENYNPQGLRNLTVNLGGRLELQKLYDSHGNAFLNATNVSPRVGAIYDPFADGRSKLSFSFGRFYEAIPLNVAARYFGGEGILNRNGVPFSGCQNTQPYTWTGAGEWANCGAPATTYPGQPMANWPADNATQGSQLYNNGSNYPVQSNLQGQYHNEIVASAEREVIEDLTVRLDYQHRWIGNIIEDGAADPSLTFVLANPGNVPASALTEAQNYADQTQAALAGVSPMDPSYPLLQSQANAAAARLAALKGLANAPKPQRTYDAITASINKRFSKNWLTRASYTYSRLIGNYDGLYQAEQNYFAPNGNNAYDTPDLYANSNGPLPNDRPHLAHVDGFYTSPLGNGFITVGLSFAARSGMPRNYMSGLLPGQQLVFLLPRGSGGRTPTTTELNGKIAYKRQLSPKVNLEAFLDLFNMMNQQAAVLTDDNYTYSWAGPIVNGTPTDLKYAKDISGAPIAKNPNYGRALLYQRPFNGRLGLRLTF